MHPSARTRSVASATARPKTLAPNEIIDEDEEPRIRLWPAGSARGPLLNACSKNSHETKPLSWEP
jgi:hypothetical protein